MFSKKIIALLVGTSLLPLLGFAVIWQFNLDIVHPTLSPAEDKYGQGMTLEKRRNMKLDDLTRTYRSRNPDGRLHTVDGRKLAPLGFINGELDRKNASWRVRIVDGEIDFIEVT